MFNTDPIARWSPRISFHAVVGNGPTHDGGAAEGISRALDACSLKSLSTFVLRLDLGAAVATK